MTEAPPSQELSPEELKAISRKFDLALVGHLDLRGRGLASLNNFNLCLNLKFLCIADNGVTSLLPLRPLSSLQFLDARGNKIADLSPLAELKELFRINLEGNQISLLREVFALKGLPNLAYLSLKTPSGGSSNEVCRTPNYRRSVLEQLGQLTALDYLNREDSDFVPSKEPEYEHLKREIQELELRMRRDFEKLTERQAQVVRTIQANEPVLRSMEARVDTFGEQVEAMTSRAAALQRKMAAFMEQ